jgi:hypothetical protein
MTKVRKKGRSTYRAAGKDVDFISDAVRAERASTGRIGDVLIRGTEVAVSREGFTLGVEGQEIGRVREGWEGIVIGKRRAGDDVYVQSIMWR